MTTTLELIQHIGHDQTGTTARQVCPERRRSLSGGQGSVYADAPVWFSRHPDLAFSLPGSANGVIAPTAQTRDFGGES